MPQGTPSRLLLPAVAFLVLAAVGFDVGRRSIDGTQPEPISRAPSGGAVGADTMRRAVLSGRSASRREHVRERLRAEADRIYLGSMLADGDSMLRRWPDERLQRPLRVAVLRSRAEGFRESFVGNVNWAITRWNGASPMQMQSTSDSGIADIIIRWVAQLDSNRTGRTDLTWDTRGHVRLAVVHLATHTPEGSPLDERQMTALALHEIGHALGVGHSAVSADALFPVTRATDLTERDRRTMYVLYDLEPGSLREQQP
jgi:hypothetical protein